MVELLRERPALKRKQGPLEDELSVISSADVLRRELEDLHNRFDQVTDPTLIDSIIYEMQAVQLRYMYHLDLCKERGIVCEEWAM